jgi:hypothetical protein
MAILRNTLKRRPGETHAPLTSASPRRSRTKKDIVLDSTRRSVSYGFKPMRNPCASVTICNNLQQLSNGRVLVKNSHRLTMKQIPLSRLSVTRTQVTPKESTGGLNKPDTKPRVRLSWTSLRKGINIACKTVAAYLKPFRDNLDRICELVLELETQDGIGELCECGRAVSDTRCTECWPATSSCRTCFLEAHERHPFHWAEVWNSRYFVRTDFSSLGGVLNLGHSGQVCPGRSKIGPTRMTIVHVNGVHELLVAFCECHSVNRWEQLVRHRIFPATLDCPQTGFTIQLLKLCHLIALNAHTPSYALAQALRRLTNDPMVQKVPVSHLIASTSMDLTIHLIEYLRQLS